MKNLISLLKIYALNSLGINKYKHEKAKQNPAKFVGMTILTGFVGLFMFAAIFLYCFLFGTAFKSINAAYLMPALFMFMASMIIFTTNIFSVKGILFAFKDYDLQMALPISEKTIVASRMIILYFTNLFFAVMLMLPAMIVYGVFAPTNLYFYISYIIGIFAIPAIPILVGSVLGLAITVLTAKMKLKALAKTVASVLFFSLIMIGAFSFSYINASGNLNTVASIAEGLLNQINAIYPFVNMFTMGSCMGDVTQMLLFIAINVVGFLLFVLIVGKIFKKINSLMNASSARGDFREKLIARDMKTKSPLKAMIIKEIRRYFSCSIYVMNTLMGGIMMILVTAYLVFGTNGNIINQFAQLLKMKSFIVVAIPLLLSIFTTMSGTTAYSISLEGKNFWITKSLPVSTKLIFISKLFITLMITVPFSVLCGIVLCIKFDADILTFIYSIIIPIIFSFFIGVFGLLINLKIPKMEWSSEAAVVKQSGGAFINVFGGMIVVVVCAILVFAFNSFVSPSVTVALYSIVIAAATFIIWRYINKKGAKIMLGL